MKHPSIVKLAKKYNKAPAHIFLRYSVQKVRSYILSSPHGVIFPGNSPHVYGLRSILLMRASGLCTASQVSFKRTCHLQHADIRF